MVVLGWGRRGTLHDYPGAWRRAALGFLALALAFAPFAARAQTAQITQSLEDLRQLSIEDLANVEVTSVSKRPEAISQAPAAIFVITHDDIIRSGATNVSEALRLAPNLEVARINSQDYTISARGFNSANASDKLLVMIDGRTIYSPFFHNVVWDQHQVMLDDVERIEVISGPGGTLWGSNAVNGVVNIITKSSRDTQGGLVDLKYGSFDRQGAGRWGGKLGDDGTYRAYAMGFGEGSTRISPKGIGAGDSWNGRQTGFRTDFGKREDAFTVQGDLFENQFDSGGRSNGGNLLGRWTHQLDNGSSLEVQAFYDRADLHPTAAEQDNINTGDLSVQHVFKIGERQEIVWGAGERVWNDKFGPFDSALIVPGSQTLTQTNAFGQDTIALLDNLKLTLGTKLEYDTLGGFYPMPSARLGWQVSNDNLLWTAVSRAVETPSRLDRELTLPGFFGPTPNFQAEKLIAYEAGYRTQPFEQATLSASFYYNQYQDIRTTTLTGGTPPIAFGNNLQGDTYGFEVWGDVRIFPWWRLSPGVNFLHKDISLKPGTNDIAGSQTAAGIDPGHQLFLRSYIDLPGNTDFFVSLRQIGALPLAHVPSYYEVDLRFAWHVTPAFEASLTGQNLAHAHHLEATNGFGQNNEIPRSILAGLRWSF